MSSLLSIIKRRKMKTICRVNENGFDIHVYAVREFGDRFFVCVRTVDPSLDHFHFIHRFAQQETLETSIYKIMKEIAATAKEVAIQQLAEGQHFAS